MSELVVDASVALKWFRPESGEREATAILDQHQRGEVALVAPSLLGLELVNVAARSWRWSPEAMTSLVADLSALRIRVVDPLLACVADWTSQGLTAYDATYVALADSRGCALVTTDADILNRAAAIARPL